MTIRPALIRHACSASLLLALAATTPLQAHHPIAAKFNDAQQMTLSGQVTAIDWANPHVHVFVNVADGSGTPVNWAIELPGTVELELAGWGPESVNIGDIISVSGPTALNGTHQVWGNSVTASSGGALFTVPPDVFTARLANRPAGATPRWPDNQPRLGPPPGQTGYWAVPGKTALIEDGVSLPMDQYGLLADHARAAEVAPFQDWARDLYMLRQQNKLRDDPGFLFCMPPGGPRQFQLPYGIQFVEERERNRIFVMMAGGNGNWRLVYTDGREEVGQVSGNDDNPLFFGRAVAHWEGDTLVMNTEGFNETFWFSNGGLPHTKLLQLEERLTRTDLNTLHYAVTISDPGAYTRAWTSSWDLQWIPGEELPEHYCQDNRP